MAGNVGLEIVALESPFVFEGMQLSFELQLLECSAIIAGLPKLIDACLGRSLCHDHLKFGIANGMWLNQRHILGNGVHPAPRGTLHSSPRIISDVLVNGEDGASLDHELI